MRIISHLSRQFWSPSGVSSLMLSPRVMQISTLTVPDSGFSSSTRIGPITHGRPLLRSRFSLYQRSSSKSLSESSSSAQSDTFEYSDITTSASMRPASTRRFTRFRSRMYTLIPVWRCASDAKDSTMIDSTAIIQRAINRALARLITSLLPAAAHRHHLDACHHQAAHHLVWRLHLHGLRRRHQAGLRRPCAQPRLKNCA